MGSSRSTLSSGKTPSGHPPRQWWTKIDMLDTVRRQNHPPQVKGLYLEFPQVWQA